MGDEDHVHSPGEAARSHGHVDGAEGGRVGHAARSCFGELDEDAGVTDPRAGVRRERRAVEGAQRVGVTRLLERVGGPRQREPRQRVEPPCRAKERAERREEEIAAAHVAAFVGQHAVELARFEREQLGWDEDRRVEQAVDGR